MIGTTISNLSSCSFWLAASIFAAAAEERVVGDVRTCRRGPASRAGRAPLQPRGRARRAPPRAPHANELVHAEDCMRAGSSDGSCRKQWFCTSRVRPASGSTPPQRRVDRVAGRRGERDVGLGLELRPGFAGVDPPAQLARLGLRAGEGEDGAGEVGERVEVAGLLQQPPRDDRRKWSRSAPSAAARARTRASNRCSTDSKPSLRPQTPGTLEGKISRWRTSSSWNACCSGVMPIGGVRAPSGPAAARRWRRRSGRWPPSARRSARHAAAGPR